MKQNVYIFRGAPASGKGSVVPEFCKLLAGPVALIEQDMFRWGIHLAGRSVQEVEENEHDFAYKNMRLIYEEYLKNNQYNIVLEGLFTWDDTDSSQGSAKQLIELAEKYGASVKSIVITADKAELLKRNSKRPYSVPVDEFERLYTNTYKSIGINEIQINSTDQNPEETLQQIKSAVLD